MVRKGKPLQRRTGLKTNTPLRSTKPLKRVSIVPGKSTVNPIKAKRQPVTPEEKHGKKTVRRRSRVDEVRMCEIAIPSVCLGRAVDWHHRQNRSQAGTWDPANGMDACRKCHAMVTDTRPEYYDNGWCVKSWDNPLTRPVLRRGQWVLLDNDGGFTPSLDLGVA